MYTHKRQFFEMLGLSLVICRNKDGKYLAVKESRNRGWWVAGGRVDPPESFFEAAAREAKEEAGIDIELKGILRIEYNIQQDHFQRIKVIFYSEPKDENQKPKDFADKESELAEWLTLEEIKALESGDPGWRGPELYEWGKYLEDGGVIYPLSMLNLEGSNPVHVGKEDIKTVKDLK